MRLARLAAPAILALALLAAPLVVEAQRPGNVPRIGYLEIAPAEGPSPAMIDAFRQGLRELGYVEGRNIVIEYRSGGRGGSTGSRISRPS